MSELSLKFIDTFWDKNILPTLQDYIKIPNKSPQFEPKWETNGHMDAAVSLLTKWCEDHKLNGMKLETVKLPGRTPLIYIEIPGDNEETVLLYGHLDKQPEMQGWDADLHPWQPILRDDKLYGRGSADDGYALFASLNAVAALQEAHIPHARCIILIEASEESGSPDLPFYIEQLEPRLNQPNLVICLDSGCGNYDQLWATTSLRGLVSGVLTIEVLKQGVHSGNGSGVAPSCFRILRQLLNRIEDETTGNLKLPALQSTIPDERLQQATAAAAILKEKVFDDLPLIEGVKPEVDAFAELIIRRTWRPTLSIIGIGGVPNLQDAGNVTLPAIAVKLSFRLPPTCDADEAGQAIKQCLEKDPPYGSRVNFKIVDQASGWNAPAEEKWLTNAIQHASSTYFGKAALSLGEGGSIPFMGMLGKKFPKAQFLITGVLGPGSNAHGPNEFLHIPTAKRLTACVASVLANHFTRSVDRP